MKQIRQFCKDFDSINIAEAQYKIETWKRSKKPDNQIEIVKLFNLDNIMP